MSYLVVDNLSKRYESQEILHQLSFSAAEGEFIVIVGPSGCGKSTLLRLIAGLDEYQQGSLHLNGRCIDSLTPAKRQVAMVF